MKQPTISSQRRQIERLQARITGWTGASNEHTRDAAMVAWPYRSAK